MSDPPDALEKDHVECDQHNQSQPFAGGKHGHCSLVDGCRKRACSLNGSFEALDEDHRGIGQEVRPVVSSLGRFAEW